jgi:hypothetical protein
VISLPAKPSLDGQEVVPRISRRCLAFTQFKLDQRFAWVRSRDIKAVASKSVCPCCRNSQKHCSCLGAAHTCGSCFCHCKCERQPDELAVKVGA